MIRTFKKFIVLGLFSIGFQHAVNAQTVTINITFVNGHLNAAKTSYSFDLMATRGLNYDPAIPDSSNWQFMNLRSDVQVPVGVSISSTSYTANSLYSTGGAISTNPPGSPPNDGNNWAKFSINITRLQQLDIPAEGAILGSGVLNFSGAVNNDNKIRIRPFDGTSNTAFWTNLDPALTRKKIVGPLGLPLPVKLIDFSAAREGNKATLNWSTSEEANSDYFELQRSGDAKEWHKLKSIPAKGESSVEAHYSAIDENPLSGKNYYRLKMVDQDGTFALSRIRDVEFDIKKEYTLFPNPVTDKLNFKSTEDWNNVSSIKIYNARGMEVYSSPLVPAKEVTVKNWPSGAYVVKLSRKNGEQASYQVLISR